MTPLEAIPAIEALLERLIHESRDTKTLALVKQIEAPYRVLQSGYFEAEQKATKWQQDSVAFQAQLFEANRKIGQMEDSHPRQIAELKATHLQAVTALQAELDATKSKLNTQNRKETDKWIREMAEQARKAEREGELHNQ